MHLEAVMVPGKLETRGVQGDAAEVRSLYVQTHLTAPCPGGKPCALDVGLQIQIALQRRLVQQRRQVHVGQLQTATVAPRRSPGIELPVQVETAVLGTELAAHGQSLRRPLSSQGEMHGTSHILTLQHAPQLCHVERL